MASSSNPDPGDSSYVKMRETDLKDATLIGQHCEMSYCNQLDFLPFLCQSCKKTFCLDHRTEEAHKCDKAGAWGERKRQAELAKASIGGGRTLRDRGAPAAPKECASPACRDVVGTALRTGVHCAGCNRDYCLRHRLREDHDCANLVPIGARPARAGGDDAGQRVRSALDRLRAWGSARREAASRSLPRPKPSTAAQRMVAVSTLKKSAKGDDKLAPEKRVYVYVEAEAETTKSKLPKGQFFYSKDWVIGRVLDAAARSLQVENVNNQSSDETDKLRVFHVEGGRLLEFNEKVGAALQSGNTIVLLRGVGPPPTLIDL